MVPETQQCFHKSAVFFFFFHDYPYIESISKYYFFCHESFTSFSKENEGPRKVACTTANRAGIWFPF